MLIDTDQMIDRHFETLTALMHEVRDDVKEHGRTLTKVESTLAVHEERFGTLKDTSGRWFTAAMGVFIAIFSFLLHKLKG